MSIQATQRITTIVAISVVLTACAPHAPQPDVPEWAKVAPEQIAEAHPEEIASPPPNGR